MHLPELDRYSRRPGFLQSLDPRFKLWALGLFLLATNLSQKPPVVALALGGAVFLLLLAHFPKSYLWWHLRVPFLVGLLMAFLLSFSSPNGWWAWPTPQSLTLGLIVLAKVWASFAYFLALIGTSPLHHTLRAARSLKVPAKFLALLVFSYRYLFVLLDGFRTLKWALAARGFQEKTSWTTYRTKARLYVILLARAYEETEKVLWAMYARGFSSFKLPPLPSLTNPGKGGLFLLFPALLLLLALFW